MTFILRHSLKKALPCLSHIDRPMDFCSVLDYRRLPLFLTSTEYAFLGHSETKNDMSTNLNKVKPTYGKVGQGARIRVHATDDGQWKTTSPFLLHSLSHFISPTYIAAAAMVSTATIYQFVPQFTQLRGITRNTLTSPLLKSPTR